MNSPRTTHHHTRPLLKPAALLAALAATLGASSLLTGCGGVLSGTASPTGASALIHISGNVHGGQQPVAGSTIQLYTVGTSGLKSASTALIGNPPVTTDAGGNFTITGRYTCAGATEVYITATGGNPGAGNNSALTLASALGPCSSLTPLTFIQINEVTTIAAAYALAPFAADITHIGATGSNPVGLVNAFNNAALLVDYTSGSAPGVRLAAGVTVPVSEINSLGNIIAACVNTSGPTSPSCAALFNATGASETFGASLAIARAPGAPAITGLYTLATPSAPFQPSLTTQPKDFTVAVSSTANGNLLAPYGIAIDASGNAWITNEAGTTVTQLSAAGASLNTVTAPNLFGPQAVAIDRTGNVWVANTAGNSVVKFALTAGLVTSTSSFTAGGITAPAAIALDSAGNAFVANFNGNSVTGLSPAGVPLPGSPFTAAGAITVPDAIAVAPNGSIYVASGTEFIVNLSNTGATLGRLNDGYLQGPQGVVIDPATSRIAATGFTTGNTVSGALSQFLPNTSSVTPMPVTASFSTPAGIATDGASLFVVNNVPGGSLTQVVSGTSTVVSPAAGYGSLSNPAAVAVDSSGSVWTTNSGTNTVSKFIGLAVPTATPLAVNVGP